MSYSSIPTQRNFPNSQSRRFVNTEVVVEIAGRQLISSIITKTSAENLGLEVGKEVYAIVKASEVMIGTDE